MRSGKAVVALAVMLLVSSCVTVTPPTPASHRVPAAPVVPGATTLLLDSYPGSTGTVTTRTVTTSNQWALSYSYNCTMSPIAAILIMPQAPGSTLVAPSFIAANEEYPSGYVGGTEGSNMLFYGVGGTYDFSQVRFPCPWRIDVMDCPARGCHAPSAGSHGVVSLSGPDSYNSRSYELKSPTAFAMSYDCTAHYETDGGGYFHGDSMTILNAQDGYDALVNSPGGEGNAWETYIDATPTHPLSVFFTVDGDCPWMIDFGPPQSVKPLRNPAPGPSLSLPVDETFTHVVQNDAGNDNSLNTESFTVPASGWAVDYTMECYAFTDPNTVEFYITLFGIPATGVTTGTGSQELASVSGKLHASGSLKYGTAGTFFLSVTTAPMCYWHLAVRR